MKEETRAIVEEKGIMYHIVDRAAQQHVQVVGLLGVCLAGTIVTGATSYLYCEHKSVRVIKNLLTSTSIYRVLLVIGPHVKQPWH